MGQSVMEDVEPLSDAQRWAHLLALGRRALADAQARNKIDALAASPDFYPRQLALMSSFASGDPTIILAALTGRSGDLFGMACNLAARRLDDAALIAALPDLPKHRRAALARALARVSRATAIEGAFARLTWSDQAALIAYASPHFVESHLATDFAERLGPDDWGRLGARHPAIAQRALAERLAQAADPSYHLVASASTAIVRMANTAPRLALALLRSAAQRAPLSRLYYGRLASFYPAEIAALILADTSAQPPYCPPEVLRRVDDATRLALLRLRTSKMTPREFQRLSPGARQRLYATWIDALRGPEGALPEGIVAALPQEPRHREARHAWSLPPFAAYPAKRLPFIAFLPFEEARREAGPFASQPDAELRALANAKIIGVGRYEPSRLPAILDYCRTKKNEQDPVRLAMMTALAQLPPSRWLSEHLPALESIIGDALAARDCSAQTMTSATRLLMGLTPFHFEFVAREMSRLVERMGGFYRADLRHRFSDAQMRALAPHILPLLETWRARSYNAAVLGFLAGFGQRLKAAPALLDFVAGMTSDPRQDVAGPALALLADARAGDALASLIPRLLEDDPSWIRSEIVAQHLHRRRQDLLTPFLSPRAYKGRFTTAATRIVPNYLGGFRRWTQTQQQAYANALIEIARSHKRSAWELRFPIAVMSRMPAIPIDSIAQFAGLEVKDVALRDTALSALGHVDSGRGAPTLVAALADERARVAIYALRRIVLDMPSADATALLQATPLSKVTVAKEVVRLAGELESEPAYRFLSRFVAPPDTHVDVRIAVMRALWAHLERPGVWDVFAAAARDDNPAVARATIRIPGDRLSRASRRRLAEQMALLLRHSSPLVRLETLRRLVATPIEETTSTLTSALAGLLARPTDEEVGLAAAALARATPPEHAGALAQTFAAVGAPRALQAIVAALVGQSAVRAAQMLPAVSGLIDILVAQRRQVGLTMRLALHALPPEAFVGFLRGAAEAGL
ncbi:MAG: HEAT repeat domain-containing protein, partial [Roseiarcus sp.]